MTRQADARALLVERGLREGGVEKAQQSVEGVLVAAVRGRGEEDEVPLAVRGEPLQQLEALMPALMRPDAGMRLVDDDQRRASPREAFPPLVGLDVIEADHGEGMRLEQGLRRRQASLEAGRAGGGHLDRIDVELGAQLARPLLDEMRRAEHGEPVGLAAVDQLAQDEAGFYRLADTDIVGDQQAHDRKPQRHQERHELIGARLETEPGGRAERTGAAAERHAQRVREKARHVLC